MIKNIFNVITLSIVSSYIDGFRFYNKEVDECLYENSTWGSKINLIFSPHEYDKKFIYGIFEFPDVYITFINTEILSLTICFVVLFFKRKRYIAFYSIIVYTITHFKIVSNYIPYMEAVANFDFFDLSLVCDNHTISLYENLYNFINFFIQITITYVIIFFGFDWRARRAID